MTRGMGFGGHFAQQQTRDYECPLWVISGVLGALADVRFTPDSDGESRQWEGPQPAPGLP